MKKLLAGMVRFQNEVFPRSRHIYQQLAREQQPETLFICCSDSRVVPHDLTQTLPGELFICRNAGNIVPAHGDVLGGVSATVEYAVQVLKVTHVIICGHSDCGAMKGLLNPASLKDMPQVRTWLRHAAPARLALGRAQISSPSAETLVNLTKLNVRLQLDRLSGHPKVQTQLRAGTLELHGWYYRIDTGEVEAWQAAEDRWVAVQESRHRLSVRGTHGIQAVRHA